MEACYGSNPSNLTNLQANGRGSNNYDQKQRMKMKVLTNMNNNDVAFGKV